MLRRLALVLALAVTIAVAGCGDDEQAGEGNPVTAKASAPAKDIVAQIPGRPSLSEAQAQGTYVGTAGGRRGPAVAFVVQGDQVVVYVCDGRKRGDWFGGRVSGDRFEIETEDGTRVAGTVASSVTGTVSVAGGPELRYVAVPARKRPRTGLYVFDDPGKNGFKARWVVTEKAVHGISTTTTGTTTNALRVTTTSTSSSGSTTDSRFSGVNSQIAAMLAEQKALAAELAAAQAENVSLRETLGSKTSALQSKTSTTK